jgi:hypothetical protein
MVLQSNLYVCIMVLQGDSYCVTEKRLGCYRVTVRVLQSNGYDVTE